MPAIEDPNDATAVPMRSTVSAAFVVRTSSDLRPDAALEPQREHEEEVAERALDEALEMTFPASDPVSL